MNKKNFKIIINIFFIIIAILLVLNINTVNAKQEIVKDQIDIGTPDARGSEKIGQDVLGLIQVIGIIISVGVLMVIGIKYMLAAPGDRAGIKKYSIKYIIGALILFGASGIVTIVRDFTKEALNEYSSNP